MLEKKVGETPLSCLEDYRQKHPDLAGVPMAYAGRLDPMASGKMLILVGDECKNQTSYHGLDKEYEFSVLLGIESDSLDVLGRLQTPKEHPKKFTDDQFKFVVNDFIGDIELPYPKFSAKTVKGKPLHMWTLEGRLDEIDIPTKQSTVYSLNFTESEKISREKMVNLALEKVNSIPTVTDPRKALGQDFRRADVRADWQAILDNQTLPTEYQIAHFKCTASSGTYMRTLSQKIAKQLGSVGLAWSIHRSQIGIYQPETNSWTHLY
jgi:tRNA pseudouridine(55) synthase